MTITQFAELRRLSQGRVGVANCTKGMSNRYRLTITIDSNRSDEKRLYSESLYLDNFYTSVELNTETIKTENGSCFEYKAFPYGYILREQIVAKTVELI